MKKIVKLAGDTPPIGTINGIISLFVNVGKMQHVGDIGSVELANHFERWNQSFSEQFM